MYGPQSMYAMYFKDYPASNEQIGLCTSCDRCMVAYKCHFIKPTTKHNRKISHCVVLCCGFMTATIQMSEAPLIHSSSNTDGWTHSPLVHFIIGVMQLHTGTAVVLIEFVISAAHCLITTIGR